MLRLLFIVCLPFSCFSQSSDSANRDVRATAYSKAIDEYIKAAYKSDGSRPDTLFIGQYEDLKGMQLPAVVRNTAIVLLQKEEEAGQYLAHRRSLEFINIAGPVSFRDYAGFAFVAFFVDKSNDGINWWPKYNCFIDFKYDSKRKVFVLDKQRFEYPYSNSHATHK